jgi:hypothetical protein
MARNSDNSEPLYLKVVAFAILAFVAIEAPDRVMGPALSATPVVDRARVMIDSDREKMSQPPRLVATDSQTEKTIPAPPVVANPRKEKVTRSKPAVASIANQPSPSQCGPGLAVRDLAGKCRAKPRPTMGALEIPGASAAANAQLVERAPSRAR